ncbi:MAG: YbaN family protein [Desulfobacterales bacterium]
MKKYLFIAAGSLSLSMGIIGIFLPLLPTTPFLLLAAACFLKSSERLYNWLIGHRIFGKYIENYIKYRAVSIKSKTLSIAILWCVILISIFMMDEILIKALLGLIAIGVTWHLLSLKTLENIADKDKTEE